MNIQGYRLEKVNEYRYKVVTDIGVSQHNLCEIAQYLPIEKWYLVKESLNYELSEDALKFIYESVKLLNRGEHEKDYYVVEYFTEQETPNSVC